jgi:hypothetical protein
MSTINQLAALKTPLRPVVLEPLTGQFALPADALYAFATFNTSQAFEKLYGIQAPPVNPRAPRKEWIDTSNVVLKDGKLSNPNDEADYTVVRWRNGKPTVGTLTLTVLEAITPNVGSGASIAVGEDPDGDIIARVTPRPIPIRQLQPNERLDAVPGPMGAGQWWVVNTDAERKELAASATAAAFFTVADRALLRAIATKLGVA